MIKLIIDSICDLPQEIYDQYDIDILPLMSCFYKGRFERRQDFA